MRYSSLSILAALFLFVACKSNNPSQNITTSPIFKPETLKLHQFQIKLKKDTTLKLPSGMRFNIPAHAIALEEDKDQVTVLIREALDLEDILKAGLTTTTNADLLSSGGMFEFEIKEEGAEIVKNIQVELPTDQLNPDMSLYEGVKDANGQLNWVNPRPLNIQKVSAKALFAENCSSCHQIAAEAGWQAGQAIPLSYPYKRYDKEWLLKYARGMANDAAADCSCDRWNNFPNLDTTKWGGAGETFDDAEDFISEEDFYFSDFVDSSKMDQGIGDSSQTEQGSSGEHLEQDSRIDCFRTHQMKGGKAFSDPLYDHEIYAIYDYISEESKNRKLPIPTHNAASCAEECELLIQDYHKNKENMDLLMELLELQQKVKDEAQKKADEAFQKIRSTATKVERSVPIRNNSIVREDRSPTTFNGLANVNLQSYQTLIPRPQQADYYVFDIKATGWRNIDVLLKKGSYPESELLVEVKGAFRAVDVFVVIPSIKCFAQLSDAEEKDLYQLTVSKKVALPQGVVAWVYAIGEEDERFFLGQQAFETTLQQRIPLTPKQTDQNSIQKALNLMSRDLSIHISDSGRKAAEKEQAKVAEAELKLDNTRQLIQKQQEVLSSILELMNKPKSCACACDFSEVYEVKPLEKKPKGEAPKEES
jgi:cell division septum initiation protein DivIVA